MDALILWGAFAGDIFTDVSVESGWMLAVIFSAAVALRGVVLVVRFRTVGPAGPGAGLRLAAGIIDLIFAVAISCLVAVLLLLAFGQDREAVFAVTLLAFVPVAWIYRTVTVASRIHATPGKALARLEVTDLDGAPLTLRRSALRSTAHWLSPLTFGVGSSAALFTADGRALHDILAGTVVGSRHGVE